MAIALGRQLVEGNPGLILKGSWQFALKLADEEDFAQILHGLSAAAVGKGHGLIILQVR